MKSIYVKDLQKGEFVNGEAFAIGQVEQKQTKGNKPFYKLTLLDKTGEINGQIWSDYFDQVEKKAMKVGKVVMITGKVEEYRNVLQLNIQSVQGVNETALDEFVEGSDFDLDELWLQLEGYREKIQSKSINEMLDKIFSDKAFSDKYKVHPAAQHIHHSFRGGLLEHVLEMLDIAESMKKYYPEADYDLVRAGIILHDIGKLYELEVEEMVVQRSKEGFLIGHLIKSYDVLVEYGTKYLTEEELINLKHIILSHHGLLEYGSPVIPSSIEAAIVNAADEASSKVRIFQKVLRKSGGDDEFTAWDNILKTRVYKGPKNDNDDEFRLI